MPAIPIIDTHQHLWELDRFPYSWTTGDPTLGRSFRMADYQAAIEGLNVVGSVHVEADVDAPYRLRETEWLATLVEQPDNPLRGIVAGARPESEEFPADLKALSGIPAVKGIRRILHVLPAGHGTQPPFIENIRRLAEHNLSFDQIGRAHV